MPDGLRARAAAVQLIALAALVPLAVAARARLPLGAFYPVKSAACFILIAVIVVVFAGGGTHPFRQFGAANQVTTARAMVVALVAGAIGEPAAPAVAATAAGAGLAVTIMDGLDGWMARRSRMPSLSAARFEMEVDAIDRTDMAGHQAECAAPHREVLGEARHFQQRAH